MGDLSQQPIDPSIAGRIIWGIPVYTHGSALIGCCAFGQTLGGLDWGVFFLEMVDFRFLSIILEAFLF